MDIDVFVATHRAEWDRLEALVKRASRLSGAEVDELVGLYQRAATHLSVVRSATPDPQLVGRLSVLVAHARAVVAGAHAPAWRDLVRFFTRRFPAAVYQRRYWWLATTAGFLAVSTAIGVWVGTSPLVESRILPPDEVRELTRPGGQFETYYSSAPAGSFAAHVWTNNAWVATMCLVFGIALGLPVFYLLWSTAVNVGASGALMFTHGRLGVFFGLILPHGMLELTGVFVAAGAGLRLGWTLIDPGRRRRAEALAEEGRTVAGLAAGLICLFLVSGVIEAFVTPSGLPTWARIGIGLLAETAFLGYVVAFGRPAARAGETGDLTAAERGDLLPVTG